MGNTHCSTDAGLEGGMLLAAEREVAAASATATALALEQQLDASRVATASALAAAASCRGATTTPLAQPTATAKLVYSWKGSKCYICGDVHDPTLHMARGDDPAGFPLATCVFCKVAGHFANGCPTTPVYQQRRKDLDAKVSTVAVRFQAAGHSMASVKTSA